MGLALFITLAISSTTPFRFADRAIVRTDLNDLSFARTLKAKFERGQTFRHEVSSTCAPVSASSALRNFLGLRPQSFKQDLQSSIERDLKSNIHEE